MRNLFRQHEVDEPAIPRRSLENTHHAVMAAKAMMRRVLWLRTERWEGVTHVSGDTCLRCERKAGVSAPIVLSEFTGRGVPQTGVIVRYRGRIQRSLVKVRIRKVVQEGRCVKAVPRYQY